ncbi:MAG: nuclear transport factor 2 family protein [Chitinophaga sp.]|uniref:nuclear transport factor 2 family protein n=1 Tax=Chitinophaga sp. TaxID=1869181 RepID=UPI001B248D7D|nr:nuclear transport factor 2 family protein [Chitinophaga sp.]MBO9730745.1 nuclear transport factor 2 family protein [Chitinophaga sp.]
MNFEKELQYLQDRIHIQDTISRYAIGQDAHQGNDWNVLEQWKDTFTSDAMLDFTVFGIPVCSYEQLAFYMRGNETQKGKMNEVFSNWQHMLGLPLVSVQENEATARTDVWATHNSITNKEVSPYSLYAAGAFHDKLVRTPQGWRIQLRRMELYFMNTISVVAMPGNVVDVISGT